jgi:tetratricopeptide (TPR) repeat protein
VYTALQSVVAPGSLADAFAERLASYIESLDSARSGDLPFLNLRDVHRRKLEQLAEQRPDRDAYLYCLLHAWGDAEVRPDLVGDPCLRALELMDAGSPADLAVVTAFEALEALYRKRKYEDGVDAARRYLRWELDVFHVLESAPGISRAARLRTMHHHAKALRNVQLFDDAIALCEQILREEPLPGTKLLLARLILHKEAGRDRAKDLLYELLEEARQSPHEAQISVTLAAIENLGRHQLNLHLREALARFGEVIAEYVVDGAARGFDLAFTAFAAIGRDLQYNDEQLFNRIFARLPDRGVADVRGDGERAAWGDILLSAAKGMEPDRRERALREAVSFYRTMENPESFNLQQLGQTYYQLGEFELAAGILAPIVRDRPNPWNRYWLSKTRLAQGDAKGALLLVDEALRDERAQKYRAALLEHRHEIRRALRDEEAAEDLEAAVAACDDQKYKEALEQKLSSVRAGVQ